MFFSDVEGSHIAVHLQLFISVSLMFLQSVMRAIVVAIPQASLQSADLIGLHRALCDGLSHHCTSSVTLLTEPFLLDPVSRDQFKTVVFAMLQTYILGKSSQLCIIVISPAPRTYTVFGVSALRDQ